MSVYLLGRGLKEHEFSCTRTITLRMERLARIDREMLALVDRGTFGYKASKHGFPVLYSITSDGTTHGKTDHHQAIIRTAAHPDNKGKRYIALTSSSALSKTAKDNAKLNLKVLIKNIDKEVLPFLGSGTVDNASSARCEVVETFESLMDWLREHEMEEYTRFWGVDRLPVIIPDVFHIDNIAINAASLVFSGDTERGNFRFHHARNLLQSIHSLHSQNKTLSQQIIDRLLEQVVDPVAVARYVLTTCRERPQRWRVNGLFSARILPMMDIILPCGKSLLTRWAWEINTLGGKVGGDDSQWMKEASNDVIVMSQSPVIKVSLAFEMELVTRYFDITHIHHAFKGEFGQRAGFITLELHRLFIDFILPVWMKARSDPGAIFPKTWELIEALDDAQLKATKKEQLQCAIEVALDKVSKNSELLFEAPLIYLLLTHPVEGPYVLGAILTCVVETGVDLDDVDSGMMWIDDGEDLDMDLLEDLEWNVYTYGDLEHMPPKMRVYYEQLRPNAETCLRFFRQFGFARAKMKDELVKLLNEMRSQSNRRADSDTPLQDFKKEFPIIFDALECAFGYSASNSRIVEMLHSFVRSFYDPNTPSEFLDNKLRYLLDQEKLLKDERREMSEDRRDESLSWVEPKDQDRKSQQALIGTQLEDSGKQYLREVIEELFPTPFDQLNIKVRTIAKEGLTTVEREHAAATLQAYKDRRRNKLDNRRTKQINLDETQKTADDIMTNHDKYWGSKKMREYAKIVEKVATVTYFKSVTAGKDFHDEVRAVLPFIGDLPRDPKKPDQLLGKTKLTTGAGNFIGVHLATIRSIAKGKAGNDLNDTDLSNMTEDEIMREFVHANRSANLAKLEKEIQDQHARLEAIYKTATAAGIAPRFLKMMNEPVEVDEDDADGDDADDAGGDDAGDDIVLVDTSMEDNEEETEDEAEG